VQHAIDLARKFQKIVYVLSVLSSQMFSGTRRLSRDDPNLTLASTATKVETLDVLRLHLFSGPQGSSGPGVR
jgi:hypothetical protein